MPRRKQRKESIALSKPIQKMRAIRRLHRQLESSPKIDFLLAIKSISDIQSGHPEKSVTFNDFPREALTSELTSPYYFHPWLLETLANELLSSKWNPRVRNGFIRSLNPRSYHAIRRLYNLLYSAESASDGPVLRRVSVTKQIERLTRRQAEWQRKLSTSSRLLTYHTIYCTSQSREYFLRKHGVNLDSFTKCTFAIFSMLIGNNCIRTPLNGESIGLTADEVKRTIDILSLDIAAAFTQARSLRSGYDHLGYAPSLFRTHPLIRFRHKGIDFLTTPIADLIFFRMTEGLYYDFVDNSELRNIFSENLENLVKYLFTADDETYQSNGDIVYGRQNSRTPDVLLTRHGHTAAAIEVKGRRQRAQIRFGEDPLGCHQDDYDELAKGINQLWRFCRDSALGTVPDGFRANNETVLGLCTLDTWLEMSWDSDAALMELAHRAADKASQPIPHEFRRDVARFSYTDISNVVSMSNIKRTIEVIRLANTERYKGWLLTSILSDAFPGENRSVTPADESRIDEVVPWWSSLRVD